VHKGLSEFQALGLIPKSHTKISAAQAKGCSPVVTAIQEKSDIIKPVTPKTIAKSIAIGNPADGYYASQLVQKTSGFGETATDEEIIQGIRLLAKHEGVFTETAGGTTVAVLKKLAESGKIPSHELVVAYITGNGLKTQEAVENQIAKPYIIQAKLSDFRKLYDELISSKKVELEV
jgi:threonine synthase